MREESMKRVCAVCEKEKDTSGGKVCSKGHFICKEEIWSSSMAGTIIREKDICPICRSRLK